MINNLPDGNSNLNEYEIFADVDFIVTDLDGTLIDGTEAVLGQVKKTISKLKRDQTQITVATGRTYYGAKPRIQEIGVEQGIPIALYNGGIVIEYGTEKILYASYIPQNIVFNLLSIVDLEKANIYVYTFTTRTEIFVFQNEDEFISEKVYCWGKKEKKYDVNGMLIQYMNYDEPIQSEIAAILVDCKMLSNTEIENILVTLNSYSDVRVTNSGNGFIEIKGIGMNKGIIYNILKNHPLIKANKILAIGDNDNDVELFDGADISVAVLNSSMLALEHADYLCAHKSASGFLDMLYVLENAKKYWGETNDKKNYD